MSDEDKLRELIQDVLLLTPEEYRPDLCRDEVETWDSLAMVAIAVGIDETFGYHPSPEEATKIGSVQDVVDLLRGKGVAFT